MNRRFITQQDAQSPVRGQYTAFKGHTFPTRHQFRLLVIVLLMGAVSACSRADVYDSIALPPTPVVTLRPTWALVRKPYLRLYTNSDSSSGIAGHLRGGNIAEISAIGTRLDTIDGDPERWYLLETNEVRGWTPGGTLELFTSQERARNATRNSETGE